MWRKIVSLILLCCEILLARSNSCKVDLKELANEQMLFSYCVTMNSVPVTMCVTCQPSYKAMLQKYDILSTNCSDIYFDKDRINLIASTQSVFTGLWSKAYCDDCLNNNNSNVFNAKNTALNDCLSAHKADPCTKCKSQYLDLNNFYINLDQHNNGEVCYDLQDSMNRTRNKWSKELNCCRREQNLTLFIIVLGITSCLPLLFYGSTYFITKRQELHQRVLYNEEPYSSRAPTSRQNNISNSTQPMSDNIPCSSNTVTNNFATSNSLASNGNNKTDLNDTDSSDDDLHLSIPIKEKIKKM